MAQQPAVTLTSEEREILENFVHRGKANARTLTRAHPAQISRRMEYSGPCRRPGCVPSDGRQRATALRPRGAGGGLTR